jgi:UDPglucose 6-dehydrogenase/GDP-mannose 6-dehydrogenase
MPLLDAVIQTNLGQPERMIGLLEREFASLENLRVTVLGLAFKEDTDDMRDSPSIPIVSRLIARGAIVTAYDPIASETARSVLPPATRFASSLEEALAGCQAVLLVTRWEQFKQVSGLLAGREPAPLFVDGRRFIERQSVLRYAGIGR